MKITKLHIVFIAAIPALITAIFLSAPRRIPTKINSMPAKTEETPSIVGKYELSPAAGTAETVTQQGNLLVNTEIKKNDSKINPEKIAVVEDTPSSGETVFSEEPEKPGKYPTPEQSREMEEKGIVLY